VFGRMEAHGYVLDVITLIKGLCRVGRMEDALKIFNQMVGKQLAPNFFKYNELIDGLCKTRKSTRHSG
jgi:pentatricopeptide repeat protein